MVKLPIGLKIMDNILESIPQWVLLGIVVPIDSFGNGVNFFTDANSSLQLGILNHRRVQKSPRITTIK